MRKVFFEKILVSDFMCYEAVKLDLPDEGLWLVEGRNEDEADYKESNGSGKSALADALAWGLFGKTVRDLSSAGGVARKGAVYAEVTTWFAVPDVGSFVVRRRRGTKSSLEFTKYSVRDNAYCISLSKGSIAETQEEIERVLGMDFLAFSASVAFGGASEHRYSTMTNKERMDVLTRALGTEIYEKAADSVKKRLKDAQARELEAKLRLQDSWRELEQFRDDRKALLEQADDEEKKELEWLAESAEALHNERSKVVQKLEEARLAARERPALKDAEYAARARWVDASHALAGARSAVKGAWARYVAVSKTKTCDTCLQEVSPADIGRLHNAHVAAERQVTLAADEESKAQKEMTEAAYALEKAKEASRVAADLAQELAEIDERIRGLENRQESGRLALLRAQAKAALVKIQDLKKKRKVVREAADRANEEAARLVYLESSFRAGLVRAAIEAAVPTLNEAAGEAAQKLADGNVDVEFATAKGASEKLDFKISSAMGADTYEGSSKGEKAIGDLCAALALQAVQAGGVRSSIAIYDEVFDHLDPTAAGRVLELLREQAKDRAVLLITHQSWLKEEHFAGKIVATKKGGSTKIEVDRGE